MEEEEGITSDKKKVAGPFWTGEWEGVLELRHFVRQQKNP